MISYTLAVIVAYFLTGVIAEYFSPKNAFLIAGIVAIFTAVLAIKSVFRIVRTTIEISGEVLEYKVGAKVRTFNLEECEFSARSDNQDTKDLFVWREGRKVATLECEMLSEADFEDLLKNLGVIGQKAKAVELKIKKK